MAEGGGTRTIKKAGWGCCVLLFHGVVVLFVAGRNRDEQVVAQLIKPSCGLVGVLHTIEGKYVIHRREDFIGKKEG